MAGWGFRSRNSATGSIQIDGENPNIALLGKGTITTGPVEPSSGVHSVGSISVAGEPGRVPLIAVRCTAAVALASSSYDGGSGQWTFQVVAKGAARSVAWYAFGEPAAIAAPGWGVRIKKAGTVIWDTRDKPAVVVGELQGVRGATYPSTSLPAGKTYALLMAMTPESKTQSVTNTGFNSYRIENMHDRMGWSLNGASVASENIRTLYASGDYSVPPAPPPPGSWHIESKRYHCLFLDVTGF